MSNGREGTVVLGNLNTDAIGGSFTTKDEIEFAERVIALEAREREVEEREKALAEQEAKGHEHKVVNNISDQSIGVRLMGCFG